MKNNKYVPLIILLVSICSMAFLYGCGTVAGGGGGGGAAKSAWIYVSDMNNYRIVVIDGTTNTTVEPIILDEKPTNIAASPDGKKIYCSVVDDEIYVIDTTTNTSVEMFTVSPNAANSCGMIVSPDNKYLYLTSTTTKEFFRVDLTAGGYPVQSTMLLGYGGPIALNSDNTKAYVCVGGVDQVNTTLEVINLQTMTKEASINVVNHPYDITIKDNYAYVAMSSAFQLIARVDLTSHSVECIDFDPLNYLRGVASIPGQDKLYFSNNIASPAEIQILKPSKFPTMETTPISSSELSYPERIVATANYAYVVDANPHDKIVIIDVNTDEIVKYIYGLNGDPLYSNPVVVYK